MIKLMKLGVLVTALLVNVAWASSSFRLDNGKIIRTGMSQLELSSVAGRPMTVEKIQKLNAQGEQVDSDEQKHIYRLKGSIGGEYLVAATIRDSKVVALEVIQSER